MSPLPARPEANAESDFRVVQKWSLGTQWCPVLWDTGIPNNQPYPSKSPIWFIAAYNMCNYVYIYIHTHMYCIYIIYIHVYVHVYTPVFGMMFITTPHSWLVYGMVCSGVTTL